METSLPVERVLHPSGADAIRVRQSRAAPAVLVAAGLVLGELLGWFAPAPARGLANLLEQTPIPVHGLLRLLAGFDRTWSLPVLGGAGLGGGTLLAVAAVREAPVLDVAGDHLEHRHGEREVRVERRDVTTVVRDGRDLVLLLPDGGLRVRLDVDDLPPEGCPGTDRTGTRRRSAARSGGGGVTQPGQLASEVTPRTGPGASGEHV